MNYPYLLAAADGFLRQGLSAYIQLIEQHRSYNMRRDRAIIN